ncbi:MAG: hypothetical protein M3297_03970 [Thermoproteota archaeon]|jgi:hypothetical protein|nr:hypothetical protein [Thermoproteota archaeon]
MLAQVQEQKGNQKEKIKLSQILKNANEKQCFGQFMRISKITAQDEHNHTMSSKTVHEVCANGLLMLRAGGTNGSMTYSLYGYVADDVDILKVYDTLGVDPYYRIKCNRCNLLGDGCLLYRALEHMNDYHHASFNEIGSYLETLGL